MTQSWTTGHDWMSYPIQPTARVCEPVETSSGRAPRHFHYSLHVRAGTSRPEAFPYSYRGRGRPTSESTAPNILQRPERRTEWGSPLLDMCGTCLSILSTYCFGGCLAKLDRAEQRYFADLVEYKYIERPRKRLARTSVISSVTRVESSLQVIPIHARIS